MTVGSSARFSALGLLAALSFGAAPAFAQSIAEVAAYQGPDRTQRLIAGAKKEKVLMVYGSTVAEDMRPVSDAFRKKYGSTRPARIESVVTSGFIEETQCTTATVSRR